MSWRDIVAPGVMRAIAETGRTAGADMDVIGVDDHPIGRCISPPHRVTFNIFNKECIMAKGEQRSNKMAKKPKKDSTPPQDSSGTSTRPTPPTTAVLPKGKLKNK